MSNSIELNWKSFSVNVAKVNIYFKANLSSNYDGLVCDSDKMTLMFITDVNESDLLIVNTYWSNATPQMFLPTSQEIVTVILSNAISFGNKLITEMAAENILLGITQAGKTNSVRKALAEVINALQTGSLYDAIVEARLIPDDKKDLVFITNARLLVFINKIETYLNLPLSLSL